MTVAFGATGAPTLSAVNSKGVASITRTGAGAYTIVLQDVYVRFMTMQGICINATAAAAPGFQVISETVSTLATKAINVKFFGPDGTTATDPSSGEEWRFQITLKRSSAR